MPREGAFGEKGRKMKRGQRWKTSSDGLRTGLHHYGRRLMGDSGTKAGAQTKRERESNGAACLSPPPSPHHTSEVVVSALAV